MARDEHADVGGVDGAGSRRAGSRLVKADVIARMPLGRLTVADVDRWHARLRGKGVGESSLRNQHLVLRAALSQAARWGWVSTNVVALATLGRRKTQPRSAMSADEVRAVIAAATGSTRRPVLRSAWPRSRARAARSCVRCVWTDLDGDRLTIDSQHLDRAHRARCVHKTSARRSSTRRRRRRTSGSVRLDERTVAAIEALQARARAVGSVDAQRRASAR